MVGAGVAEGIVVKVAIDVGVFADVEHADRTRITINPASIIRCNAILPFDFCELICITYYRPLKRIQ
jgi:hypothetical protein